MSAGPGLQASPRVQVAVGVLLRADGAVLMADRPAGKPYAGYWEFPGGKIERGESVEQALARELAEELHIRIGESLPWVVFEHDYPHAFVRLHFRRVYGWSGEPAGLEGQRLRFLGPHDAAPVPLLPAAHPAWHWLKLPDRLSLSEADEFRLGGERRIGRPVRDAGELARAAAGGADFAVAPRLAERELARLCHEAPIPVYAPDPGGPDALQRYRRLGVHGLTVPGPA